MIRVSSLTLYPVKSMGGVAVDQVEVRPRGFAGDRRYMVVGADGRFMTAREWPELVRVQPEFTSTGLKLTHAEAGEVSVEQPGRRGASRLTASVWRDLVDAAVVPGLVSGFLSDILGTPARLVYMDDIAKRPVTLDWARDGDEVSFADAFPVLVISDAALSALNERAGEDLSVRRFRPNMTVSGTEAHAEDGWREIELGTVRFDVGKPCERCVLTTVDPVTAAKHPRSEPLRTLAGYRRGEGGKVYFGMNMIPRAGGVLHVGDPVSVISNAGSP